MSTKEEILELWRFLSQDAKVPPQLAMSKVQTLKAASLTTPEDMAKESVNKLVPIFGDEKLAKSVLAAAKRVSKKRASPQDADATSPKRARATVAMMKPTAKSIEASLELPDSSTMEEELSQTVLYANRAPLVLAFAVKLLEHTQPKQPLSSRLSLAQAVVSANSRSKAVSLGLESGPSAEEQGWGQGQPMVKVMGREIRTLKRYDYDPKQGEDDKEAESTQSTLKGDDEGAEPYGQSDELALWGLDLEAMRDKQSRTASDLPIYRPESARSYLLKAFASAPKEGEPESPKKKTASALAAEKEANCGLLLRAIDLLLQSWVSTLGRDELDRRAWSWYVHVRPDVASGVAGWGGRNEIRLKDILDLRRKPDAEEGPSGSK
jgi:hypothetical protein